MDEERQLLLRRLERERQARKQAEQFIELRSRELYLKDLELIRKNEELTVVERDLRRERDFVTGVIDTAQAVVLVVGEDQRIVRANAFAAKISGDPGRRPRRGRRRRDLLRARGPGRGPGASPLRAHPGPRGRRDDAVRHPRGRAPRVRVVPLAPPRSRIGRAAAAPGGTRHDRAGATLPRGRAALDHRPAHRARQSPPLRRDRPARGPARPASRPSALRGDAGHRPLQVGQRQPRPRDGGPRARGARGTLQRALAANRPEGPAGRGGVLPAPPRDQRGLGPPARRANPRAVPGSALRVLGAHLPRHRQPGCRRVPGGRAARFLVARADHALYVAKGSGTEPVVVAGS